MGRWAYSSLLLAFFIPTYWLLWSVYKKQWKKHWKLICAATIFCAMGTLITIPIGAAWGAWGYDLNKTWQTHVGADLLETILWGTLSGPVLGFLVGIFAQKEEKKKPFFKIK